MHIQHLERGDVILNAKQTEDLKKHGEASGKGKVVGGQSAFAQGTLTSGMPAHASLTGGGTLAPTYDLSWDHSSAIDDDLPDFSDGLNDAGDGLDDFSDGLDDALDDAINKSKQLFDYVEIRLNYLNREATKIVNRFSDWMTETEKKSNIKQQMDMLLKEINEYSTAAFVYGEKAMHDAYEFKYYEDVKDANGNSHQVEKNLQLAYEINLEDLISGRFLIDEIDTSDAHGQAVYDAAQHFMDLMSKAQSANDQLQQFSNSLGDLYSQLLQMPFDKLEKEISELERQMSSLSAFMDAETSGDAGFALLQRVMEDTFGKAAAQNIIRPMGTYYQTLNSQMEQNLDLVRQQVEANQRAYDEAERNHDNLRDKKFRTDKQMDDIRLQVARSTMMSQSDRDDLNSGNLLDLSHFGDASMLSRSLITWYNQLAAESKQLEYTLAESQEKLDEQEAKMHQSAAEYAAQMIQVTLSKIENINSYYTSLIDYQEALNNLLKKNQDYLIKWQGYIGNAKDITKSYSAQIEKYAEELRVTQTNVNEQLAQLKADLERVPEGTKEWRDIMTKIKELEGQVIDLKDQINEAYKAMADVPNKIVEEKLERIRKKYVELIAVMDKGLDSTRSYQRAYVNLATLMSGAVGVNFGLGQQLGSNETYKNQAELMEEDISKATKELTVVTQGFVTAKANLDYAMANRDQYTEEDIKTLEDAYNTADENLRNKMAETAKLEIDNAKNAVDNIDRYYSSLLSRIQANGQLIEANRKLMENTGLTAENADALASSYLESMHNNDEKIAMINRDIAQEEAQIEYNLQQGWWDLNDEDYINAKNHVDSLRVDIQGLLLDTQNLYQNMLDMPSRIISNTISSIDNYSNLEIGPDGTVKIPTKDEMRTQKLEQYQHKFSYTQQAYEKIANTPGMTEAQVAYAKLQADAARGEYIRAAIEDAEAKQNEANKASSSASSAADDIKKKIMDINNYFEQITNKLDALSNSYQKLRDTFDEFGRSMDKNGNLITDTSQITATYTYQIDTLTKKLQNQSNQREMLLRQLEKEKSRLGENSQDYIELEQTLHSVKGEILDTIMELDKLRDAFREAIYFKPYEEAIEKLKQVRSTLKSVNDLISDQMKITRDGEFTQLGVVSLTLDVADYNRSLALVEKATQEYYENEQRWALDATYSDEEYLTKQQEIRNEILANMADVNAARDAIIQAEKSRYQQEVSYIKDLISAQSDELRKRKEIADYEKNLRVKSKNIQQIEMEIQALQGLENMEAKSQLARLKAQRDEANEDMNNTVEEHILEMREKALDDLSEQIDKDFNDWSIDLEKNISSVIKNIDATSDALALQIDQTNASMQAYLGTFGVGLSTKVVTGLTDNLTVAGELNTPNKDEIKAAADTLVTYYQGYTAKVFDEKISSVHDDTSKQVLEQEKINTQFSTYMTTREAEREADAKLRQARETTLDTQHSEVLNKIETEDGRVIAGLIGDQDSIKIATQQAAQANADQVSNSINTGVTEIKTAMLDLDEKEQQELENLVNTMLELNKPKEEEGEPSYDPKNVPSNAANAEYDKAPSIKTGTKDAVNPNNTLGNKPVTGTYKAPQKTTTTGKGEDYGFTSESYAGQNKDITRTSKSVYHTITMMVQQSKLKYKDYGFSSQKAFLDAMVNQKQIKVPKGASNYVQSIIDDYNNHRKDQTVSQLKSYINTYWGNDPGFKKYANGTLNAVKGIAQVFEEGPEIITTKKGTFIPFEGGEGVIPAQETRNLMNLARAYESGKLELQMPDMSAYKVPQPVRNNISNSSNISIESLITINGNATPEVVDQIKEIAANLVKNRQFQENVTKFVSQRQTADGRMAGRRVNIK